MEAVRFGNGDFRLTITEEEFDRLLYMDDEPETIATAKIKTSPGDPLGGKKISLIYHQKRDRDCGLDCDDMLEHFNRPPIPVYISDRAIQRLRNGELCGTRYSDAKLEIMVEGMNRRY